MGEFIDLSFREYASSVDELDVELLKSVALRLLSSSESAGPGSHLDVSRTGRQKLRMSSFMMNGHEYEAIEQNATKPSKWGQLAREGHQVVQFKDAETNRYVAVAVDGKIVKYGQK